jgi:hypothetical protein
MHTDAAASAVLAAAPLALVLANAGASAVLARAPDALVHADAAAPAVHALAPLALMLADAGASALLALVLLSPMRTLPCLRHLDASGNSSSIKELDFFFLLFFSLFREISEIVPVVPGNPD